MLTILQQIRSLPEYAPILDAIQHDRKMGGLALPRSARLPFLAAIHGDLNRPILLLTDRADHAVALADELSFWINDVPRLLFPEPNPLFYEEAAWGTTTRRERIQALTALSLYHLPFAEKPRLHPVIVASARAVMTRTLPRRDYLKASKMIRVGGTHSIESLIRQWSEIGYQAADTVVEAGQFSRRGGLLDIWTPAESLPVRFDFFGDEIETIRRFDPATQRTTEKLESILITPAREFLAKTESRKKESAFHLPDDSKISEFHIPLLHEFPSSILDYLPQKALVLIDDLSLFESMVGEMEEQAVKFRAESIEEGTLDPAFPIPYLTWGEISDCLQPRTTLELGRSTESEEGSGLRDLKDRFTPLPRFGGRLKPFIDHIESLKGEPCSITIVSRQSKRLEELWHEHHESEIEFVDASLSEGWTLQVDPPTHLFTDSEVFGWERPASRQRQKAAVEAPEAAYADFRPGDFVVHVDHGIGKYVGLVQRMLENHEREFLCVEYDDGDQVFVPVHQADRLTRYIGTEGGDPSLTRLGGQEWQTTKAKVKEAVKQIAEELLELYARRNVSEGYSFKADTQWQKELEDSFPYIETPDQVKALDQIKRDMESTRPMDRLLCGDVGYGKTEVALRAAFKAVMDGKQVAILVPTTVLAQQHYETFTQRLAAFPVKVEMLSRFRSPREQTTILYDLSKGAIDIIVGTHRLISQDVQFKDLGLVIIDEEQRFGVTHKEHLKKLRTEVDVLTLTATPIPRTLYMALTGVRDISNLNTPPEERLPIITHVGPYSQRLVRQAILRELERGGQIFFVHNRVQTIYSMAAHLRKLVPEARIGIGHGQMNEHELSEVMHDFTYGRIDILLSTTIVESGLDIPNANTLIVDRADTFGLAQLYQLRGRVGRGAARAYAYFFRHRKLPPTIEGQERLEVIAENTQLGAGYSIAMRDLEIRGAGELLGTRQSGHIASVGFHLYTRMLAEAVKALKLSKHWERAGQPGTDQPDKIGVPMFEREIMPLGMPVTVDLPFAIGIPADYIPNQEMRLRLYRRIAGVEDESELDALIDEFNDRFGLAPEMLDNFFYQMRIKIKAEKAGLSAVAMEGGQIVLRYPSRADDAPLERPKVDLGPQVRMGKNALWCSYGREDDWEDKLTDTLDRLLSVEDVILSSAKAKTIKMLTS